MRHWLQLATRNWRVRPGRAAAAITAIALGVGTVVSITGFYESVRRSIAEQVVTRWLGRSHLSIEPPLGHWGWLEQSLAGPIAQIENVAHVNCRLKRRMTLLDSADGEMSGLGMPGGEPVDVIGIDPVTEYVFRDYADLQGRRIQPGESAVALIDAAVARERGLAPGDRIVLATASGDPRAEFQIVGQFVAHRMSKFQRPNVIIPLADLQRIKNQPGKVTAIDIMLHDHSVPAVKRTAQVVQDCLTAHGVNIKVTTAAARLEQLEEAERITQMVLLLVAFVAMLTSFFIILTTMSMGIVERIGQLGMMRCVGVTRRQLVALVMLEVLPLGGVGVLLGLPLGVGMTQAGAAMIPEYVQGVAISRFGIGLAVVGGAVTILGSCVLLVFQVGRVSPLAAANPEAKPPRVAVALIAGVVGVALIALHALMVERVPAEVWLYSPGLAFFTIVSIYGGYVLVAPAAVLTVGWCAVALIAPLLRLRRRLAQDQVTRAPWRSAGVCWMLMVGLSLIVYIGVRSESIMAAWDFPRKIPESFVWSFRKFPVRTRTAVAGLPGVRDYTLVNDFRCEIGEGDEVVSYVEGVRQRGQVLLGGTFVAGELDKFLSLAKLTFLEGNLDDAIVKLRRGGYIIIPPEAAHILGLGLGDKIRIRVGRREAFFEVAGVVQSPAVDIAVTYFQLDSHMMRAASASVLGTLADADRCFGIDDVSMYMMNIDLPSAPGRPPEFETDEPIEITFDALCRFVVSLQDALPNERELLERVVPQVRRRLADASASLDPEVRATLRRFGLALQSMGKDWKGSTPDQRWEMFREQLVLLKVAFAIDRPDAVIGSVRRLKQEIDNDVREVCVLMSAMPAIALVVAALGVANLMMVGVSVRTRQIAVLRAVGATKSQIVRLVLAEAVALGALGAVVGVGLGIHTSYSANRVTEQVTGLDLTMSVPWGQVAAGVMLTIGVCIVAGIAPARRAARNNIVDAMQAF